MIGQTLAHYKILSKLGAGGMGDVYRAQDTKLDREVALKILPTDLAQDPGPLERFEREAKAVAALKHPNIVTIYSVEEIDGLHFLTMELVEGQRLSTLLPKHGFPLAQIFDIAIPLADAVSSAHAKGITHRDLKPDNIMIDDEGRLRVLDFGLAKLQDTSDQKGDALALTVDAVTEEGKILGTVAYMSPEQAEGKPVDSRSDIFSLGTILYEMTTGARPFHGDTGISTIGAILKDEPTTVTELNHALPRHLGRIIRRCLAKQPERRYQSAIDLRNDLEGLKEELDSGEMAAPETTTAGPRRFKGRSLAAILAVVAIAAAGITFGLSRLLPRNPDGPSTETSRPQMEMTQLTHTGHSGYSSAISPDGKYVVHLQGGDEGRSLWLLQVSTGRRVQVVEPSGATLSNPTFSPDGDLIYFIKYEEDAEHNSVYKVPLLGGSPTRVLQDANGKISFSPDGARFVFRRNGEGGKRMLMTANIDGSDVREISFRTAPDDFHGFPAWSPDGKVVVPVNRIGIGDHHLLEVPAEGGEERRLSSGPWDHIERVEWLPDGSGLVLQAIKEDGDGFEIWEVPYPEGPPRKITNDLNDYSGVSLTADGTTLVTQVMAVEDALWITYPDQEIEPVRMTAGGQNYDVDGVSWTPDGRIVYGATSMEGVDLWIAEVGSDKPTQITFGGTSSNPSVSPDGKFIVFVSSSSPEDHIWRVDLDGKNLVQLTFGQGETRPRCHPDGQSVYFLGEVPGGHLLFRVSIQGGEPEKISTRAVDSRSPAISPVGDQIAVRIYDEKLNKWQVEILQLDGEQTWSVVDIGGYTFQWSPDGKALVYGKYGNEIQKIWSHPINGDPPRELMVHPGDYLNALEWAPDGKALALNLRDNDWDVVILKNFH